MSILFVLYLLCIMLYQYGLRNKVGLLVMHVVYVVLVRCQRFNSSCCNVFLGGESTQDNSISTDSSQSNLHSINEVNTDMPPYAAEQSTDIDMEQAACDTDTGLSKQAPDEAMEFEPCLQVTDLQMSEENNTTVQHPDTNMTQVSGMEQGNLQITQVAAPSNVLTTQTEEISAAATQLITTTPNTSSSQSVTDQGSSKLLMINPMSKPLFVDESGSSQNEQKAKSPRQDSLLLVDSSTEPKGDDHVFKVLLNNLTPATSCFCHPSVLSEKNNLDVRRCKNTFCDCRLYHCPLCTCLPNKPGRIREHFKKIHAEDLIVRYQGNNCS